MVNSFILNLNSGIKQHNGFLFSLLLFVGITRVIQKKLRYCCYCHQSQCASRCDGSVHKYVYIFYTIIALNIITSMEFVSNFSLMFTRCTIIHCALFLGFITKLSVLFYLKNIRGAYCVDRASTLPTRITHTSKLNGVEQEEIV